MEESHKIAGYSYNCAESYISINLLATLSSSGMGQVYIATCVLVLKVLLSTQHLTV